MLGFQVCASSHPRDISWRALSLPHVKCRYPVNTVKARKLDVQGSSTTAPHKFGQKVSTKMKLFIDQDPSCKGPKKRQTNTCTIRVLNPAQHHGFKFEDSGKEVLRQAINRTKRYACKNVELLHSQGPAGGGSICMARPYCLGCRSNATNVGQFHALAPLHGEKPQYAKHPTLTKMQMWGRKVNLKAPSSSHRPLAELPHEQKAKILGRSLAQKESM